MSPYLQALLDSPTTARPAATADLGDPIVADRVVIRFIERCTTGCEACDPVLAAIEQAAFDAWAAEPWVD